MKKVLALLFISFFVLQLVAVSSVDAAGLPFTATGRVIDRHGQPVPGATVDLIDGNYQIISTTKSDDNGNFGFTQVIISSQDKNCKVKVTYQDGQKTYQTAPQDSLWVPTESGLVKFDEKYTTLYNYPDPEYGYLWGLLQQDGSNGNGLGNGVVYASSGDQKYYVISDPVHNKGSYIMRLPVGHYKVWGQYVENGMTFQSSKILDVDVLGATNYRDIIATTVSIPLSAAASNPQPAEMPTENKLNIVSGYITYKDGKPVPDQTVTLYQSTDDGITGFLKKSEARTDVNGFYQFYGVQVTADDPDNEAVYGSKTFNLTMAYTDPQGQVYSDSKKFTLYNPNFITQDTAADDRARNPVMNFTVGYSTQGWVKISTVNSGLSDARLYVDNRLITGSDGKAVTLPYTVYLNPGWYKVTIAASGYNDWTTPVQIMENMPTQDIYASLDKSTFPPWVQLAAVVVILIIVVLVILALLFTKRQMFLGMLAGVAGPLQGAFGKSINNLKASGQAKKAHRAQMAEVRKAEQARMAQSHDGAQHKLEGKKRDHEKAFGARAEQPRLPEYRGGEEEESSSMVNAHDIYKKQDRSAVERISSSQARGQTSTARSYEPRDEPIREPYRETRTSMTPDPDGRIRVPKTMPAARDQPVASSIKDKEKVIRYIREHQDGVSFIQMSNDLEIPPNTLTMITKELVINDDIEKIKGLYYYKSHDSSSDDRESSVVVWRLDGEE